MTGAHFPESLGKVRTHIFLVITHTIIISKKCSACALVAPLLINNNMSQFFLNPPLPLVMCKKCKKMVRTFPMIRYIYI